MDSKPAAIPINERRKSVHQWIQNKVTENQAPINHTNIIEPSFDSSSNICNCLKARRALPVYSLKRNGICIQSNKSIKLRVDGDPTSQEDGTETILLPGKPAYSEAILHSIALWDPGAKTVPTTMSPTSLGFKFVWATRAYNWETRVTKGPRVATSNQFKNYSHDA
jgi:hypothetical protein